MQTEDYLEFLEYGDIRIKGHRIGIEDILYEYMYNDKTPDELAVRFPTLTLEQIYATILYYFQNQEKVTTYMTDWIDHGNRMRELQNQNPTPAMIRLRQIAAQKAGRSNLGNMPYEN